MLRSLSYILCALILWSACTEPKTVSDWDVSEINKVLSHVNEDDPKFVEKGISFDSIITIAGQRQYRDQEQRIKMKLFFYQGDYCRGYYNLPDLEDANLQVFGRRVGDVLALKCVTKINMEEAGGYTILEPNYSGIWSSGHLNYDKQMTDMKKQNADYQSLGRW